METVPELFTQEVFPEISPLTVGMGVDRAQSFMFHLLMNEKVHGEKKAFGPGILQELSKRVLFYYRELAGNFRVNDDTRIGGRRVIRAQELPDKVYLFERWLEDEVDLLKQQPEDIDGAIRVASAAHYGVVGELHPFEDGNGRVARVLMNGILSLNTKEGLAYSIYIPPVPVLRERVDEDQTLKMLRAGKMPKLIPYLQSLEDINKTWNLNSFEVLIASKWVDSLNMLLHDLEVKYARNSRRNKKPWKSFLNDSELALVEKMEERRERLKKIVADHLNKTRPTDKVPDFFAAKYIKR